MAVKYKVGLDYFSFDVDFFNDEKIEFVAARFGVKGELIAVKLLCKIYRNGYYSEWTDDDAIMFAKRVGDGVTPALVNDVVEELAKRGFFNKDILSRFKVLTSPGIQRRYLDAVERRKEVEILSHLLLIDPSKYQNVNISEQNVNIEAENVSIEDTKKSKEEYSKVKKSNRANALVPPERDEEVGNRALKKEYDNLVKGFKEMNRKDVWETIKNFISQKKPEFVDPYVDAWNLFAMTYKLTEVDVINESRKKKFKTRIQEESFDFLRVLERIKTSSYLKGDNSSTWKVTFNWIFENDQNYVKIMEGQYN